eukprot:scaffold7775_cov61-Cyclotella_meneghiniana.AAC.14
MGPLKNRGTALYSNLALCYEKLNDFASFKKAAVQCIEVNPAFVKGYYRVEKAHSKSCGKAPKKTIGTYIYLIKLPQSYHSSALMCLKDLAMDFKWHKIKSTRECIKKTKKQHLCIVMMLRFLAATGSNIIAQDSLKRADDVKNKLVLVGEALEAAKRLKLFMNSLDTLGLYNTSSWTRLVRSSMVSVGTLPNGYSRTSPLPRIPSSKSRVPQGRQLPGLLNSHPSIAGAPICVRAASMA